MSLCPIFCDAVPAAPQIDSRVCEIDSPPTSSPSPPPPQIRTIDRVCEIPHEGPFCDLMWSDPEDIETWAISPRGAGWLFGRKVTAEFNQINGGSGRMLGK